MTKAVGDLTLERPTQSGDHHQCQDPDDDTPVSPVCTPPNSPSLVRSIKKNSIVKSVKSVKSERKTTPRQASVTKGMQGSPLGYNTDDSNDDEPRKLLLPKKLSMKFL